MEASTEQRHCRANIPCIEAALAVPVARMQASRSSVIRERTGGPPCAGSSMPRTAPRGSGRRSTGTPSRPQSPPCPPPGRPRGAGGPRRPPLPTPCRAEQKGECQSNWKREAAARQQCPGILCPAPRLWKRRRPSKYSKVVICVNRSKASPRITKRAPPGPLSELSTR